MKKIIRLAIQLLTTVVLVSFPGQTLAGPPVPPEMANWVVPNASGGYDIYPTLIDDADHAQWAIDNADLHSTVRFATSADGNSDFHFSAGIFRYNFVGTVRGDGMEETTLHTLEGYDPTMLFTFQYDRRLGYDWVGQGKLTVRDFKVVVDGPTAGWWNRNTYSNEVPGVVGILDWNLLAELGAGSHEPYTPTGVDVEFRNLWAIGERKDGVFGYPWGATLLWPLDIEFFVGGHVNVEEIRLTQTYAIWFQYIADTTFDFSEIDAADVRVSLHLGPNAGCDFLIHDMTTVNAAGVRIWGGDILPANSYAIYNNRLSLPVGSSYAGIEIWEADQGSYYDIFDNTIEGDEAGWPTIYGDGLQNARINDNKIDSASFGIWLQFSSADIRDNQIKNTVWHGVRLHSSDANVVDNKVSDSGGAGLAAFEGSVATLEDNKFKENAFGDEFVDPTSEIIWIDD